MAWGRACSHREMRSHSSVCCEAGYEPSVCARPFIYCLGRNIDRKRQTLARFVARVGASRLLRLMILGWSFRRPAKTEGAAWRDRLPSGAPRQYPWTSDSQCEAQVVGYQAGPVQVIFRYRPEATPKLCCRVCAALAIAVWLTTSVQFTLSVEISILYR